MEESIFGDLNKKEKEPEEIVATSDSEAYLKAYSSFCIAEKITKDMEESIGKIYSTPIAFKLLNDKGANISDTIYFITKSKREQEIRKAIFARENTIETTKERLKAEEVEDFKKTATIDSNKIKETIKYFRIKDDEFSNNNIKWYTPRSAPLYTNRNAFYCYFQTENGIPQNLRLRLQYYADDWLFFKKVQFSIDGTAYEFTPMDTETDNGDGGHIWEWFDEHISTTDMDLIIALSKAKSAKYKLIGRQYYDINTVSKAQITSFKQTLDLYQAMGGSLP